MSDLMKKTAKNVWRASASTFYEQPLSEVPKGKYQRIIVPNAKDNFQNRGKQKSADAKAKKKGQEPKQLARITDDDINLFKQYAIAMGMNWGFEASTHTIWFETKLIGEDLIMDSFDTGGQYVRWALSMGLYNRAPSHVNFSVEIENAKKSNALALQAGWWALPVGTSISVMGGNSSNPHARPISEHPSLFVKMQEFLGVVFKMEDMSIEGLSCVKVTRQQDVPATKDEITVDEYETDQLLMGLVALAYKSPRNGDGSIKMPFGQKVIKTNATGGYHISAMLKIVEALSIPLETNQPSFLDSEGKFNWNIKKAWIDSGAEWVIKIN